MEEAGGTPGGKPELRIGLTISGAIALGAYEGGALAALLVALQEINERSRGTVRVDAISGASAGSITGVLAARALLEGYDPIEVMYRSWVTEPDLGALIGKGPNDPLSVDRIAAAAEELLDPDGGAEPTRAQRTPIRVHMAVASLRGLDYEINRIEKEAPAVQAETYLDWGEFEFRHGEPTAAFVEPKTGPHGERGASAVEVALASGAHAAAFPPRGLWRELQEPEYEAHGITNFPGSNWLWYTDGGTINNQPLGRTLDITNGLDGGEDRLPETGNRLLLLINPDPEAPPNADSPLWADPDEVPEWTRALTRTLQLVKTQHLYDDLRQVEKTNSRLTWTGQLQTALVELLAQNPAAAARLRALLGEIDDDKTLLATGTRQPIDTTGLDLDGLVGRVLHEATGLSRKRPVRVDVVSPRLLLRDGESPERVKELLAGEFLGHFGGFLDHGLRHHDFALGYDSTLRWLEHAERGLTFQGVPADLAAKAVAAAKERRSELDVDPRPELGETRLRDLPWKKQWQLVRLARRVIKIAWRELRARR